MKRNSISYSSPPCHHFCYLILLWDKSSSIMSTRLTNAVGCIMFRLQFWNKMCEKMISFGLKMKTVFNICKWSWGHVGRVRDVKGEGWFATFFVVVVTKLRFKILIPKHKSYSRQFGARFEDNSVGIVWVAAESWWNNSKSCLTLQKLNPIWKSPIKGSKVLWSK